jgi:glutaconate CoA-transferase subunit B
MSSAYRDYLEKYGLKACEYTYMEMLAVAVSREMEDGAFAFVGTGLPLLAAGLAQQTHAKNMTIILDTDKQLEFFKHSMSDTGSVSIMRHKGSHSCGLEP